MLQYLVEITVFTVIHSYGFPVCYRSGFHIECERKGDRSRGESRAPDRKSGEALHVEGAPVTGNVKVM